MPVAHDCNCCPLSSSGDACLFCSWQECAQNLEASLSTCQSRGVLGKKPREFVLPKWLGNSLLLVTVYLDVPRENRFLTRQIQWKCHRISSIRKKTGTKLLLASSFLCRILEKTVASQGSWNLCGIIPDESSMKESMLNGLKETKSETGEEHGKQGGRDCPAWVALGLPHQRVAAAVRSVVRGRESV